MILQFFKWKLEFKIFNMNIHYSVFFFFPQDSPESDVEREKDKKDRERDSEKERARQRSESKHKSPTKKRPGKDSVSSASFFPSCLGSGSAGCSSIAVLWESSQVGFGDPGALCHSQIWILGLSESHRAASSVSVEKPPRKIPP